MLGSAAPAALQLTADRAATTLLVADIREALTNPEHDQAIADALQLQAVAVQQRLRSASPPAPQQLQRQQQHAGGGAGAGAAAVGGGMSDEQLKQQVEGLLQRTDSILSRSSGHSTMHGASASHLPGGVTATTTVTTAASSPRVLSPLHHDMGGFGFEGAAAQPALDTPTFLGSRAAGGANSRRRTTGLRMTAGDARQLLDGDARLSADDPGLDYYEAAAGCSGGGPGWGGQQHQRPSLASINFAVGEEGDIGTISARHSPTHAGQRQQQLQQDECQPGPSAGRMLTRTASRLSQQALSELREHLGLEGEQQSRFNSGLSGDQTTAVLDKSASWGMRDAAAAAGARAGSSLRLGRRRGGDACSDDAGGGAPSSIYANFAPLEQLVDAALTDLGGGGGSSSAPPASHRGSGHALGAPSLLRPLSSMLAPDYVCSSSLARLKAELAASSKPPSTAGSGRAFDAQMAAATAQLSRWGQHERHASEAFRTLLESLLDAIFARLSASKGRGAPAAAATASKAAPAPAAPGQAGACTHSSSSGGGANSAVTAAAPAAAEALPPAPPTASGLRAAFAQLMLGQAARQRGAGSPQLPPPVPAAAVIQPELEPGGMRRASADIGVAAQLSWSDSVASSARPSLHHAEEQDAAAPARPALSPHPSALLSPAGPATQPAAAALPAQPSTDAGQRGPGTPACQHASGQAVAVWEPAGRLPRAWSPGTSSLELARTRHQQKPHECQQQPHKPPPGSWLQTASKGLPAPRSPPPQPWLQQQPQPEQQCSSRAPSSVRMLEQQHQRSLTPFRLQQ